MAMRTNHQRPLEPASDPPSDPNADPARPAETREQIDSSAIGQDDDLIGAERLPRKGDDDDE
jgi:hypothetical protein